MADLDPAQWPCWRHHATLPSVRCETPEEEAALPPGYRPLPYSDEEKAEVARSAANERDEAPNDRDKAPPKPEAHVPAPRRR